MSSSLSMAPMHSSERYRVEALTAPQLMLPQSADHRSPYSLAIDMSNANPWSHIASSVSLNSYQQEEFSRISKLYTKVYNLLLNNWYRFAPTKQSTYMCGQDARYIDRCLRQLQSEPWLEAADDKEIAEFASNELLRHLREREFHGLPPPDAMAYPMTKFSDEVVFYWGYDVKVKNHTVRVPVLGKANTGRFRYFRGSISGIGIRTDPVEPTQMQCLVYYRENNTVEAPAPKAIEPASPWQVGSDPIPQSPLNQKLRNAGIGFMV